MIQSKSNMKRDVMRRVNTSRQHLITIEKYTSSQNAEGIWSKEWMKLVDVWASKQNLHGSEYFVAGQLGKERTVKFTIPYMSDISAYPKEDMRIKSDNTIYNIEFIDHVRYERESLEIKAIEVVR